MKKIIFTECGQEKLCLGCNEYFPLDSEFWYKHGKYKNGSTRFESRCKPCWEKKYRKVA